MVTDNDDFTNGAQEDKWQPVIIQTKLYAHREQLFLSEIIPDNTQAFTHVRLSIYPDGGISRLRVFGITGF
jgi:allantoicase